MKKIEREVAEVLSAVKCEGAFATIEQKLDRKLYLKVNEILEALGGKWSRRDKAHIFDGDAAELIDAALIAGEVTTKRDTGFFPTPDAVADALVRDAGVGPGHDCLEPSAGTGNIVRALVRAGADTVTIVERDTKMRRALAEQGFAVIEEDDFMSVSPSSKHHPPGGYQRIVMNPPFCRSGRGDHLDHVRHAYGFLAPGGVLKAVLPQGVVFRQDERHLTFRAWVERLGGTIESLPPLSFRPSGTDVATCVVTITRKPS